MDDRPLLAAQPRSWLRSFTEIRVSLASYHFVRYRAIRRNTITGQLRTFGNPEENMRRWTKDVVREFVQSRVWLRRLVTAIICIVGTGSVAAFWALPIGYCVLALVPGVVAFRIAEILDIDLRKK